MSNKFDAQEGCWAILESLGHDLNPEAIQYMLDADCYYEARKRLREIIVFKKSKFKKLDNGWWLIKE